VSPLVATLSYHKIGNPPRDGWQTWNYTGSEEFAAQLNWFHQRGWQFLSAADVLSAMRGLGALPEQGVLITFDDAYDSLFENALPVLEKFSAPAVVFVPTQFVGSANLFDHGIEPLERIADWGTLAKLQKAGFSVESHGVSHRGFSSLTPFEIGIELNASREAIRKNLGVDSQFFAYPYGDFGTDSVLVDLALQKAGYEAAFLYGGGIFEPFENPAPFSLPRLAMGPSVNLDALLFQKETL